MGVFNNFPYANFHELNADWIIEQIRKVMDEWEEYRTDMNLWKLGVDNQLAAFQAWFDNLDVQDEVRTVINELIQSGEFIEIAGPQIVSATEAWLAAHITPTTPAVDNTLSISGAAADAKVTGDRISDLKEDFNSVTSPGVNLFNYKKAAIDGYWDTATAAWKPNVGSYGSDFIKVNQNTNYYTRYSNYFLQFNAQKEKIGTSSYGTTLQTSGNTEYIKISGVNHLADMQNEMFAEGTVFIEYIPYELVIREEAIEDRSIERDKIADGAVNFDKLDENIVTTGLNLFDYTKARTGGYWRTSNGTWAVDENSYGSDFIKVNPSTNYYTRRSNYFLQFNAQKEKIATSPYGTTFLTSENTEYVKISGAGNLQYMQEEMFAEGTVFTQFAPYKQYIKKDAIEPNTGENKPYLIVDKNGNGDFTTISEAVGSVGSTDTVSILVMPGEYEESIDCGFKNVELIGVDKYSCIIYNTTGDYDTPPLYICSGRVSNLSIKMIRDPNVDYSGLTHEGYAIHIDNRGDNKKLTIDNCIIHSDFNNTLGCGAQENMILDIENCEVTGQSNGINLHGGGSGMTLIMNYNHFKTIGTEIALNAASNANPITVKAIYNVAKRVNISPISNVWIFDTDNFGNSNASLNNYI